MSATPNPTQPSPVRAWLIAQAHAWRAEHAPDLTAVHAWHTRSLAATGPVPVLGSQTWVALPDTDPRKAAAAFGPALAHLTENTPAAVAVRLRAELAAIDHVIDHIVIARVRAASWDLSGAQDWRHTATGPNHAELVRRRSLAKCFHCKTEHPWTATHCPHCGRGWTPEQIHVEATRSWTTPATPNRRVA